jgi:hypothetical protein
MRNADPEGPQFLHIYEYIGSFIWHNTQHHTTYQKLFPKPSAMYVVTYEKDLISMCDRIDIKPSSKIYMIQ